MVLKCAKTHHKREVFMSHGTWWNIPVERMFRSCGGDFLQFYPWLFALSSLASQSVCCGEPKCFATGTKCRSPPTSPGTSVAPDATQTSNGKSRLVSQKSIKKPRSPHWMWRVLDITRIGSYWVPLFPLLSLYCLSISLSIFAGPLVGRHGTHGILWHNWGSKFVWFIQEHAPRTR